MVKTIDIVYKATPAKKAIALNPQENFLVYLGEDYLCPVSKARACGLFMGSKDKITGEVDLTHSVARSHTAIQLLDKLPGQVVLLVAASGFYLMERTDAMEIAGQSVGV